MTIDTMRWHEAVNVHYDQDFRRQSLVQLARRYVLGPRVLDMRCITGSLALQLAADGMDVTALDGYAGAVEVTNDRARSLGLPTPLARLWDLTGLIERVGEAQFDTIACLDVLNHVADDEEAMRETVEALKPGGRLVLAVPAFPSLLGRRDRSLGLPTPLARLWDLTGLVERVGETRFDTIACLDVLNHVADDEQTMRETVHVLKPDGRLILAVPAFPALLGRRDRSLGHLRRYTRSSLAALLARHGLAIDLMRFWNVTALPLYALIERGMRARISDEFRYGYWGAIGSWPNRCLTWWYTAVENRLRPPCGLTLSVVGHKA